MKHKVFALRLPEDLYISSKVSAKKDSRSMNSFVVKAIEEKIKKELENESK